MITGQVIFQDAGTKDGKKLVMVVGILAMPEGLVKDGHQYTLCGTENDTYPAQTLLLMTDSAKDMRAETRGQGLGNLVKLPIWRV